MAFVGLIIGFDGDLRAFIFMCTATEMLLLASIRAPFFIILPAGMGKGTKKGLVEVPPYVISIMAC